MNYREITDLYRQVGRLLHENHAEKVYLIHSRTPKEGKYEMILDLIIDGCVDIEELKGICASRWPNVLIHIQAADMEKNRMSDYIEDAIIL